LKSDRAGASAVARRKAASAKTTLARSGRRLQVREPALDYLPAAARATWAMFKVDELLAVN